MGTAKRLRHSSAGTSFLVLAAALFCVGCLGEGGAIYRGTVTAAPTAGYSFDSKPNPDQLPPVVDAVVTLFATIPEKSCDDFQNFDSVPVRTSRTDANGVFSEVSAIFGARLSGDVKLLVCVTHPKYKPFEYAAIYGKSSDPQSSEKNLNIRLEQK